MQCRRKVHRGKGGREGGGGGERGKKTGKKWKQEVRTRGRRL